METLAQSIRQATDERAATSLAVSCPALEAVQSFSQAAEALKQVEILLSRRGSTSARPLPWSEIAELLADVSYQRLNQKYKELAATSDVRGMARRLDRQSDGMRAQARRLHSATASAISTHAGTRPLASNWERQALFETGRSLASAVGDPAEALRHSGNGRPATHEWELTEVLIAVGVLNKVAKDWQRLEVLIALHGPGKMTLKIIGECLGGVSKQLISYHYGKLSASADIPPFLSKLTPAILATQEINRRLKWAVLVRRTHLKEYEPKRRRRVRTRPMSDEEAQAVRAARLAYLREYSAKRRLQDRTWRLISAWADDGSPPLNEWLRTKSSDEVSLMLAWAAERPDLVDAGDVAATRRDFPGDGAEPTSADR